MTQYIIRRLLLAVFLMFMVATLVFLMIHLVPGDVVDAMVTEEMDVSEEVMEARRRLLGLDQPLPIQYARWMWGFVRGDWGISPFSGRPVMPDIMAALPRTLELVIAGTLLAWCIGIPLGIFAAVNHGSWLDTVSTSAALVGLSTPVFVTGTMLILILSLHLRLLPAVSGGYVSLFEDPGRHLQQLILPTLALGISMGAVLMQMTRSSLLEVLRQDYIRTARAKGLNEPTINWRHALKNALIPVVTLGGMQMGALLGGTVIIEAIFMWPGLSTILISSVQHRDYPLVHGTVFLLAAAFILITLAVDILNAYLDPRIRYYQGNQIAMSLRKRILRNPRVLVSGSIVLILILSAICAPLLAPHDPYKVYSKHAYGLPSPEFPLGNDDFGRDILSRLLFGARISLRVAFSAVLLSLAIGVVLGLSAGYYGGAADTIIMRSMDVILSFPTIVLAIAVIAFLGNSLNNVILVIALLNVPRFARITYSSTQSVKHNQYVEASRAIGAQDWRLLSRSILPNILAPLFVAIALTLGAAILVESGSSFLGLGVPPPEPSWGTMVSSARMIMDVQPVMVIWPSLILAITVLSFNTLGNGLRDALDPRLREA